MDIRARIQAVIDAKAELTVRNVSLAAGLSDSALHKFLTGATNSMTLETVDKIAEALGVDPAWLAHGVGDPDRAGGVDSALQETWEDIAPDQRDQALKVLRTFRRTGTGG